MNRFRQAGNRFLWLIKRFANTGSGVMRRGLTSSPLVPEGTILLLRHMVNYILEKQIFLQNFFKDGGMEVYEGVGIETFGPLPQTFLESQVQRQLKSANLFCSINILWVSWSGIGKKNQGLTRRHNVILTF
jgi:hypothetical protein